VPFTPKGWMTEMGDDRHAYRPNAGVRAAEDAASPAESGPVMKHHPTTDHPLAPRRAHAGSVEWEELPALTHVVVRRPVPQASYAIATELVREAEARLREAPAVKPVWTETLPAIFDPLLPSAPLADTHINGLASREILEPDVFRHFFGADAAR
jgi:hypothetical protein